MSWKIVLVGMRGVDFPAGHVMLYRQRATRHASRPLCQLNTTQCDAASHDLTALATGADAFFTPAAPNLHPNVCSLLTFDQAECDMPCDMTSKLTWEADCHPSCLSSSTHDGSLQRECSNQSSCDFNICLKANHSNWPACFFRNDTRVAIGTIVCIMYKSLKGNKDGTNCASPARKQCFGAHQHTNPHTHTHQPNVQNKHSKSKSRQTTHRVPLADPRPFSPAAPAVPGAASSSRRALAAAAVVPPAKQNTGPPSESWNLYQHIIPREKC